MFSRSFAASISSAAVKTVVSGRSMPRSRGASRRCSDSCFKVRIILPEQITDRHRQYYRAARFSRLTIQIKGITCGEVERNKTEPHSRAHPVMGLAKPRRHGRADSRGVECYDWRDFDQIDLAKDHVQRSGGVGDVAIGLLLDRIERNLVEHLTRFFAE